MGQWRNQRGKIETSEHEDLMVQNRCNTAKTVPRGKFIAMPTYLKKQGKSQINNLVLYLKELEEQTKPKVGGRKELIKIRAEISEIETKKCKVQ